MTSRPDILKAIRSGKLGEVIAALDAGACVELDDGQGDPGLPLAMACFLGHAGIVRELVRRGAKVNLADNKDPASPLSMALSAPCLPSPSGQPAGLPDHALARPRRSCRTAARRQKQGRQQFPD